MRRAILLLLLGYSFVPANGQYRIDSLFQALSYNTHDSDKVKTIYRISSTYAAINQDSSLLYANKALHLAKTIKFRKGEAVAIGLEGDLLWKKGEYAKAFEKYLQSLRLSEEANFMEGIASAYNNMALVQVEQRDFGKATKNFQQAIKYFKMLGNNDYLLLALMNNGDCYEKMDSLQAALDYQNEAYELSIRINDKENEARISTNLGNIQYRRGNTDIALSFYRQSLPKLLEVNDRQFLSESYQGIAKIFADKEQLDSSIVYARRALVMAEEDNYAKGVLLASNLLSKCHAQLQNTDSALAYLQNATIIRDTINDEKTIREVERLSIREQIRQEGIAAEKERLEQERKNNLQMLAIVIFIISLFGFLALWSKRKVRPKFLKYLGLIGLLMTFEFISIFLHPFIGEITHHVPVLMLLTFVTIALLLVPLHHKMEHWVEVKLAHKRKRMYTPRKGSVKNITPAVDSKEPKRPI